MLAILVASVVPASERPSTGAPSDLEHIAIYLLTGMAFGIAYWKRLPAVAIGLVVFSALVEAAQLWIPGRHARLSDLVIDIVASYAGVALAVLAERLIWQP